MNTYTLPSSVFWILMQLSVSLSNCLLPPRILGFKSNAFGTCPARNFKSFHPTPDCILITICYRGHLMSTFLLYPILLVEPIFVLI